MLVVPLLNSTDPSPPAFSLNNTNSKLSAAMFNAVWATAIFALILKHTHMKKAFILVSSSILIATIVNGQLSKGNWLVGGSASFSSTKISSDPGDGSALIKGTNTDIEVAPNIGYFAFEKFAVGLRPGFSFSNSVYENAGDSKSNTFLIGPFTRYYFLNAERKVNLFAEISYQYGFKNSSGKGNPSNLAFYAGPSVFFNETAAIQFTLGYIISKDNINGSYSQTNRQFQLGIGFQIHLQPNK
jgi:hypothetical protein